MHALSRRHFLAAVGAGAACGRAIAELPPAGVRVGLTPVFLDNQLAFLNAWRAYLQLRLKRPVSFVQRGSYRDVVGLLQQGQLDFAWLCGYPYVRNTPSLRLLAVPLYRGRPVYQSYLVVPAADRATTTLLDLRGKVFAYSDPDSNSGHLHTLYSLLKMRESPVTFFARTFFTYGHRKVVDAVRVGLAHGGAVDGYVWETLAQLHPELTARTRIVERSPEFGFPPFVAGPAVASSLHAAMQHVLIQMSADPEGLPLLRRLNLDGFQEGHPGLYRDVLAMSKAVNSS
jgi:phosphonate transport system substrate-binding protein